MTDSASNHSGGDELLDDSPTDELPVLSELDVVEDFERTSVFVALDDDGGGDTALHRPPRALQDYGAPADPLPEDPTGRFAQPAADAPSATAESAAARDLENRLSELAAEAQRSAALLADKDATIASLEERLTATRDAVARRDDTERRLRAELAERETLSVEAEAAIERREAAAAAAEHAAAAREAELAEREAGLLDCETALEELEAELAARAGTLDERAAALDARDSAVASREAAVGATAARELEALQRARETLDRRIGDQLAAYAALEARLRGRDVEQLGEQVGSAADRRAAVDPDEEGDLRAALIRSREHAAALESYIEGRRARWHDMEARIAEQEARLDELGRELEQRAERQQAAQRVAEAESRRVADLKAEVAALRRLADSRRAAPPPSLQPPTPPSLQPPTPRSTPPAAAAPTAASTALSTAASTAPSTPVPAAARLPAPAEAADSAARLRALAAERDALTAERDALRRSLDRAEASLRRLERRLVEQDRVLHATETPTSPAQREEDTRFVSTLPGGAALPRMPSNDRMAHAPPMIVCLTGDAPRNFPLRRASVTIGRGAGCDIQIATHFVSREHARLTVHGGQVRIEDLGSKNGVFVNAVRVERETLRHGDLITVGESQFRFMAE